MILDYLINLLIVELELVNCIWFLPCAARVHAESLAYYLYLCLGNILA